MRTPLLLLPALAAASVGATAQAASRNDVPAFLDRVGAVATAKVNAAHLNAGRGLALTGRLDGDGRLADLRIVASSGSAEADRTALRALHRMSAGPPPTDLGGAELTLSVGAPRMLQAKAP